MTKFLELLSREWDQFVMRRYRSLLKHGVLLIAILSGAPVASFGIEVREISLPTNDLLYDPVSGMLYASTPSRAGALGNSIVPIDPLTGVVGTAVFVGNEPDHLAISDNGQFLYVSLIGDFAVRVFDVPTQTAGLQFGLRNDPFSGPLFAEDIAVQPGQPGVIAVSHSAGGNRIDVAIYEDGVMRPNVTAFREGGNRIEFSSDPSLLYGFNNQSSGYQFSKIAVDASGVAITSVDRNFITGAEDISFNAGLIYTANGVVLEPNLPSVVGTYVGKPSEVFYSTGFQIDSANGFAYFLNSDEGYEILVFDTARFTLLKRVTLSGISGSPTNFVQYGPGQFALSTDVDKVFFVEMGPPASPSITIPNPGDTLTSSTATFGWAPNGVAVDEWWLYAGSSVGNSDYFDSGSLGNSTTATVSGLPKDGSQVHVRLRYFQNGIWRFSDFEYTAARVKVNAVGIRELRLPTNDLAFNKAAGLLYASVPGRAGGAGNSVVSIDPTTAETGVSTFVGSEPGPLGASDDGQSLYVSLIGAFAVRVFDWATQIPGAQFDLGSDPFSGPFFAEDIEVQPGNSGVIAVSRRLVSSSTSGVAIYENGVARPVATNQPANRIEFSDDPSILYGQNIQSADSYFRTIAVDAGGAQEINVVRGFLGPEADIEFHRGLVYSTNGFALEPSAPSVVGTYPELSSAGGVQVDSINGVVYFLSSNEILVFDLTRFTLLERISIPGIVGAAGSLVQYGPGQLAFRTTGDQVFLVDIFDAANSPFITAPTPDSRLSSSSEEFRWETNGHTVAEWGLYVGSSVGMNDYFDSGPLGSVTSATVTGLPTDGSRLYARLRYFIGGVWLFSDFTYGAANVGMNVPGVRQVELATNDLVYEATSGMLYASVPGRAGGAGNSIVPIDPTNGETGTPVFVGSEPGHLALSDDGQVLYVSLDGAFAVRQFDTPTQTPGLQFNLGSDPSSGPFLAEDIDVQPGDSSVIAVSLMNLWASPRHGGVAIYDNGTRRLNVTQGHTGSNRIEFSNTPSLLYGHNNETTGFEFRKIAVDAGGAVETSADRDLIRGFAVDIEYASGLIYATTGVALNPDIPSVIGEYPGVPFSHGVQVDSLNGLVYFLTSNQILLYDLASFAPLKSVTVPGVSGTPSSLVRFGPNLLAFRTTGDQVFLIDVDKVLSPRMSSPLPGSTLTGTGEQFSWDANGNAVDEWWLYAGSSAGASEYFDSGSLGTATVATVSGLPTDGSEVHVRLWYRVSGLWQSRDFQYTAADIVATPPEIIAPTPLSVLSSATETFLWAANGTPVTEWWLYVGATVGGSEHYNSGSLSSSLEATVSGLPTNGSQVHARLWFLSSGAWLFRDAQYTAADIVPPIPTMTDPTPGGTLTGPSATFRWSPNGATVSEWWLYVGSALGGADHFSGGSLGGILEINVPTLPTDGSQVYVRLWYRVFGAWLFVDFQYAATDIVPVAPLLTDPTPGATLTGPSATFRWISNGTAVSEWWLHISESNGGTPYFDSGSLGTNLELTVNALPVDGSTVHIRLWYRVAGGWQFADFQYIAALIQPTLVSPPPGSTLTSSSVLMQWSANGSAVTEWWLYTGSSLGANDYFDSASLGTQLQTTVSGLPVNGTPVHVRLWFRINGMWQSTDFQYTATSP